MGLGALLRPHCLDTCTLCTFRGCLLPSLPSSFFCRGGHSNTTRIGRKVWYYLQLCPLGVALATSKHTARLFSRLQIHTTTHDQNLSAGFPLMWSTSHLHQDPMRCLFTKRRFPSSAHVGCIGTSSPEPGVCGLHKLPCVHKGLRTDHPDGVIFFSCKFCSSNKATGIY